MSNTIMDPSRIKSIKRPLALLPLGTLLLLLAFSVSGSQCAKATDQVLSPSSLALQSEGVADCVALCVADAKASRTTEQARHKAEVMACEEDEECLEAEETLHTQIMEAIAADFGVCHSGCHNQGGGSGGQ